MYNHIGLTVADSSKQILVQLNPIGRQTKLLDMNALLWAVAHDPAFVHIISEDRSKVVQALYACTGCDYTSFFKGIGKAFILQIFFNNSTFISGDLPDAPGSLCHLSPDSNGYLAFLRLVGVMYFMKHNDAFGGLTPVNLLNSISSNNKTPYDKHSEWLNHIIM